MPRDGVGLQPQDDEGSEAPGRRDRASRIPVASVVMLNPGSEPVKATACDVSERGLKVALDAALPSGLVSIKLPGFPIVTGEVRWSGAGRAGLRFLRPIPSEYLATWVSIHGIGGGCGSGTEEPERGAA